MKAISFRIPMPPDGKVQSFIRYSLNAGEEIPLHTHHFFHVCCVLNGSVKVYDDVGKSAIIPPNAYVEFPAGRWHAIRAEVDGTEFINLNELTY